MEIVFTFVHILHKTYKVEWCFSCLHWPHSSTFVTFLEIKRNKALTVKRTLTHCNALHCMACHNEQKLSGARGERTRGDVERRTGAKCYAKTGGDLVGKVHTLSVHELAPDGNWHVGKAEGNCIDKLRPGRP